MDQQAKKIVLKASLENLTPLMEHVLSCARQAGLSQEDLSSIHLAADEACTNIINYAFLARKPGMIEICCQQDQDRFVITIRDQGEPFDPTQAPPPDLEQNLDDRPIGGLGIFLMKQAADQIFYRRDHGFNELMMIKFIKDLSPKKP